MEELQQLRFHLRFRFYLILPIDSSGWEKKKEVKFDLFSELAPLTAQSCNRVAVPVILLTNNFF